MARFRRRHDYGFTLIELMIVVGVIAILAAVAIPLLSGYITRSKASETANVMQGIREKEEAYFANFKRYTADIPFHPVGRTGGVCCSDTVNWEPLPAAWKQLGYIPDGATYYAYQVTTNYNANGTMKNSAPTVNIGTNWPAGIASKPWFIVQAQGNIDCGDSDGDGTEDAHFYITSHSRNVYHEEEGNEY
jgi:prepilin-type N-terminal cleavage/methylation domain-containing protein